MKSIILESILEYKLSYEFRYYLENYNVPMRTVLSFRAAVECFIALSISAIRFNLNPQMYSNLF